MLKLLAIIEISLFLHVTIVSIYVPLVKLAQARRIPHSPSTKLARGR